MASARLPFCSCFAVLLLLLLLVATHVDSRLEPSGTVQVGSGSLTRQELLHIESTDVAQEEVRSYESFQEFERRELEVEVEDYPTDPADPNCQNDPTLCTDP